MFYGFNMDGRPKVKNVKYISKLNKTNFVIKKCAFQQNSR